MKPVKSPSRATALIIKKQIRKNEKNTIGNLIWPRHFGSKNTVKQS